MDDGWHTNDKPSTGQITAPAAYAEKLANLRAQVDEIDQQLSTLLAIRHALVLKIADVKHQAKMPIQDSNREKEVIQRALAKVQASAVPFVSTVYRTILDASRASQNQ